MRILFFSLCLVALAWPFPSFSEESPKNLIKVPDAQKVLKQYFMEEANKALFKVNQDQAIGLACIELCVGEPICSAYCATSGLLFKEVKVCLTTPEKCFGENNEIRKFIANGFKDITQGPGSGNEIVKAREAILQDDQGDIAQVVRDPIKKPVDAAKEFFGIK